MDAKRGQIPGKPDEMQKKEFSKRQIRGPSVPRAQEWSSPFRAKMELKITDSTAPALGRAPAILISEVYGTGKGKASTASQGSPSDSDVVRS